MTRPQIYKESLTNYLNFVSDLGAGGGQSNSISTLC